MSSWKFWRFFQLKLQTEHLQIFLLKTAAIITLLSRFVQLFHERRRSLKKCIFWCDPDWEGDDHLSGKICASFLRPFNLHFSAPWSNLDIFKRLIVFLHFQKTTLKRKIINLHYFHMSEHIHDPGSSQFLLKKKDQHQWNQKSFACSEFLGPTTALWSLVKYHVAIQHWLGPLTKY